MLLVNHRTLGLGLVGAPGLNGFFYSRNDPPGALASLAIADDIIAHSTPTAKFRSLSLDYPAGLTATLFAPSVNDLLGADAATLDPTSAGTGRAGPSVWLFTGFIYIAGDMDTISGNSTIDIVFGLGSDDGARVKIGGLTVVANDGVAIVIFPGTVGTASFEAPGLYPFAAVWHDHYGGIGIALSSSIPGGANSGGPAGTAGIVPISVLFLSAPALDIPEPTTLTMVVGGLALAWGRKKAVGRNHA